MIDFRAWLARRSAEKDQSVPERAWNRAVYYFVEAMPYRWYHRKIRRIWSCCLCYAAIGSQEVHGHAEWHFRRKEDRTGPWRSSWNAIPVTVRRLASDTNEVVTESGYQR